jgi:hypothetical protein
MARNGFIHTGNPSPCPKCGNTNNFVANSQQVAEDCFDCWIECLECSFDPTAKDTSDRVKCVWGDVSKEAIPGIFVECWERLIPTNT